MNGYPAGRLRHKLHVKQDFLQIVLAAGGEEAFVFHADLGGLIVFQQAERRTPQQAAVGIGVAVADADWSS